MSAYKSKLGRIGAQDAGARGDEHAKKKGDHTDRWVWSVRWVMGLCKLEIGLALLGLIWA